MIEHRWVRVTTCDSVPPREGRAVCLADREIAIFNLGDRFLATDNRCPHKGGPLCDGIVTGSSVVCPLHTWKINLESGDVERPAAGAGHSVTTYRTKVEDGVVLIEIPAGGRARRQDGCSPGPLDRPGTPGPNAAAEHAA